MPSERAASVSLVGSEKRQRDAGGTLLTALRTVSEQRPDVVCVALIITFAAGTPVVRAMFSRVCSITVRGSESKSHTTSAAFTPACSSTMALACNSSCVLVASRVL